MRGTTILSRGVALAGVLALATPLEAQTMRRIAPEESAALRAAAARVADAVVQVEAIAGGTRVGELDTSAPTSGTVVGEDGWILTSSYVLEGEPTSFLVTLADGTRLPARVAARDHARELVLLRVEGDSPLPAVELTGDRALDVGQWVVAVGRPYESSEAAVSVGVLSAEGRVWGRALQTDARVGPGFYGGPLVDSGGGMIGVLVPMVPDANSLEQKAAWYDGGIGFAVPAADIVERLERLRSGESIWPGRLGIVMRGADPFATGTRLAGVRPQSPAAAAGLRGGDVLRRVADQPVRRLAEIKQRLGTIDAGQTVELEIERDGQRRQVTATLAEEIPPYRPRAIGLLAEAADGALAVEHVLADSPAEAGGLRPGDRITRVADEQVEDLEAARLSIQLLGGDDPLRIERARDGRREVIEVTPRAADASVPAELPELERSEGWEVTELALPDVPNEAQMLAPSADGVAGSLGLLVLLAGPGDASLPELAARWREAAERHAMVVVAVSAADPERWSAEEVEIVARVAELADQRLPIDPARVSVAGAGPGGSMAVLSGLARRTVFRGIACPADTSVPQVRMRENDPEAPVQMLLVGADRPDWVDVLGEGGYVVKRGDSESWVADATGELLGRWNRMLAAL